MRVAFGSGDARLLRYLLKKVPGDKPNLGMPLEDGELTLQLFRLPIVIGVQKGDVIS